MNNTNMSVKMSTYRLQFNELRRDLKDVLEKLDRFDHENFDTISNFEDREDRDIDNEATTDVNEENINNDYDNNNRDSVANIPPVEDDLVSNVTTERSAIPPPPPLPPQFTQEDNEEEYSTYTGEYKEPPARGRASIRVERDVTEETPKTTEEEEIKFNEDDDNDNEVKETPSRMSVHFSSYDDDRMEQARRREQRRSRTFEEKQADNVAHLHRTGSVRDKIAQWNKMAHVSV